MNEFIYIFLLACVKSFITYNRKYFTSVIDTYAYMFMMNLYILLTIAVIGIFMYTPKTIHRKLKQISLYQHLRLLMVSLCIIGVIYSNVYLYKSYPMVFVVAYTTIMYLSITTILGVILFQEKPNVLHIFSLFFFILGLFLLSKTV